MTIKTVEDIVQDLKLKKEVKMVQVYADLRKVGSVVPITGKLAREALQREKESVRLQTGTLIDEMLGGGLNVGDSMLLYGEFGSGKTEIAECMAVLCPDIVVFIDTEGSFRWKRVEQICKARGLDMDKMFDKIILYQPANWIEQMMILETIPSPVEVGKIGLIIIDSLTKLFRGIEFAGRQELGVKQPLIREYPISLTTIAKSYGAAMIFTSQIYKSPVSNPFLPDWASECVVGGPSLQHQASYVVHLRRGQGITRIARLIDADDMPLAERPYVITEAGVMDLPETDKAADILKKAEEYEKKQKSFLEDKKKKKGEKEETKPEDAQSTNEELVEQAQEIGKEMAKPFIEAATKISNGEEPPKEPV